MAGRECYHCKQWIEAGQAHDCWTTTEGALTRGLPAELREAWERLRETAVEFGDQRIYASLNSIMFARKVCYCFVRPKQKYLELCVFLGRTVIAPQVQRAVPASKTKVAHLIRVRHRDEVEAPITDWMREAYEQSETLSARAKRPVPASADGTLATSPGSGKATSPQSRTKVASKKAGAAKASRQKTGAKKRRTRKSA
jgi:hypothetical protein